MSSQLTRRPPLSYRTLFALLAAGLALGGCAAQQPAPSVPADSLVIVMPEEPTSLDACDSLNSSRSRVLRGNVVEALTTRNAGSGEVEPQLATEWSSEDNKIWVFSLREGVKFQDGADFNAAAVVTSMERLFDESLACDNANDLFKPPTPVKIEATGEYEVRFELDQPDPIFALRLTFVHISSPNTPSDSKGEAAVGTGPYKISEWAHGEYIQLERFADYWGTAPELAEAKFVFRAESPVRAAMVERGEADLAFGIASQDVKPEAKVQSFENGETTYFRMDAEVAPLDDLRIRQAINLATDRAGIIESIFGGYAAPAHEIFVPSTLGYNSELTDWAYDPAQATDLVKQAAADGVDVTKEIVFYGRPDFYANAREVTEVLESQWEQIGLNIRIENVEGGPWGEILLRPHDADRQPNILLSSHGNTTGDASFSVVSKYTCEGSQSASCSKKFDDLVSRALVASDLTERARLFAEAMKVQREEVVQDVHLAYMKGVVQLSERLDYTVTGQSDFELLISQMSLNG